MINRSRLSIESLRLPRVTITTTMTFSLQRRATFSFFLFSPDSNLSCDTTHLLTHSAASQHAHAIPRGGARTRLFVPMNTRNQLPANEIVRYHERAPLMFIIMLFFSIFLSFCVCAWVCVRARVCPRMTSLIYVRRSPDVLRLVTHVKVVKVKVLNLCYF